MKVRKECELLATCGFFQKHCKVNELACKGFVSMYCRGEMMDQCKRKQYSRKHGKAPVDEMMPSGLIYRG